MGALAIGTVELGPVPPTRPDRIALAERAVVGFTPSKTCQKMAKSLKGFNDALEYATLLRYERAHATFTTQRRIF